jgi:hypothetical protein
MILINMKMTMMMIKKTKTKKKNLLYQNHLPTIKKNMGIFSSIQLIEIINSKT